MNLVKAGLGRMATYLLAGYMVLAGAGGCKGECRRDPLTSAPTTQSTNLHPNLFDEVFDDSAFPDAIRGDFVYRYKWTADNKNDTTGMAEMDSITDELDGDRVIGYKTGQDSLILRFIGKDGRRYKGRIGPNNKRAITHFKDFDAFANDLISYADAVQNAKFYIDENIADIIHYEVNKIGNPGTNFNLAQIGNVRVDVTILYWNGDFDAIIFDTISTPIDVASGSDLDRLEQYFNDNPGGVVANARVFVFTDGHAPDVRNRLGANARELKRSAMDRSLYR